MMSLCDAEKELEGFVVDAIDIVRSYLEDNNLTGAGEKLIWINGFITCSYRMKVISDVQANVLRKVIAQSIRGHR